MADNFMRGSRKQQELRGRPLADALYRELLGAVRIHRFERKDNGPHILDARFAIDAMIELATEQRLTLQEKFLSASRATYNSVTIEYMQGAGRTERGDWFHLCAELYFVGYFSVDGTHFQKWVVLDMARTKLATDAKRIEWHYNENKVIGYAADFYWANVGFLPRECIIAQFGFLMGDPSHVLDEAPQQAKLL